MCFHRVSSLHKRTVTPVLCKQVCSRALRALTCGHGLEKDGATEATRPSDTGSSESGPSVRIWAPRERQGQPAWSVSPQGVLFTAGASLLPAPRAVHGPGPQMALRRPVCLMRPCPPASLALTSLGPMPPLGMPVKGKRPASLEGRKPPCLETGLQEGATVWASVWPGGGAGPAGHSQSDVRHLSPTGSTPAPARVRAEDMVREASMLTAPAMMGVPGPKQDTGVICWGRSPDATAPGAEQ